MNEPDIISSPDTLKKDSKSMAFFVLKDEKLVVYQQESEAPYWKNRHSYLSAGRFSPEYKKVVFWPGPVNPGRAMKLLKEAGHIDSTYTYAVPASSDGFSKKTSIFGHKPKDRTGFEKLDGVRKRAVEVLMDRGMRQQTREDHSEEGKTP